MSPRLPHPAWHYLLRRLIRHFFYIFWLSISLITVPQTALAIDWDDIKSPKTYLHTLDNGLKILVREDNRAPICVSQVWYRVGSSYEPSGITGVSHVLEHMMFKGTKKLPPGEFSKLVATYGGQENAFTNRDYTGYYQIWEKSRLPISLELEADRMVNVQFDQAEFEKELKVVMEERRLRTDDKPSSKAYEQLIATAYSASPYRQPVIGWMHDLENLTMEDVQNWYEQWYAPNNAILVVVGDVNPDEVFALAKKYFGPIPPKKIPRTPTAQEVPPLGLKQLKIELPIEIDELFMAFQVPSLGNDTEPWETYALTLLAAILDGGYSARFEKELIRNQKIASSIGAGYSSIARGDTLFMINGIAKQGKSLEELEAAVWKEIEKTKESLASPSEIERVLAQVLSAQIYQLDSISSQARELGVLESLGFSWQLIEEFPRRLATVTPEQIQQVAQKYLTKNRLTVAQLVSNQKSK